MADTKITSLTAIGLNPIIPSTFPIPMVDLSDTSMAASGTTKKVTVNQILGAGGTATLASATITGDLTVDTNTLKVDSANNRVGIVNASPTRALDVVGSAIVSSEIRCSSFDTGTTSGDLYLFTSNRLSQTAAPTIECQNASKPLIINHTASQSMLFGIGGSTAMTLNSTGLGVGASPSALLHVQKSQNSETTAIINNTNTGTSAGVRLDLQSNGSNYLTLQSYGQNYSGNAFGIAAAKLNVVSENSATAFSSGLAIGTTSSNPLYFATSNAVKMTLDASGNLLVGTTSNPNSSRAAVKTASVTSALSLNSVTGDTAQELFVINKFDSNSTTSQVFARFTNNNGAAGSGQINGNGANACAFGSFSDARLKENIVSLPSQLANILSLRPVEFDYKDGSGHQIGFVAQEIQEVYADTVAEQNGFLTVTGWSKTEARLVSAIKELAAKVQALEAKLA